MSYTVKEIYYTLQGEGVHAGRPAVFCRFAGCNLWSGREDDRSNAICQFCDTNFVGMDGPNGGQFLSAQTLAEAIARVWRSPTDQWSRPFVVCTGGEPLLQLDDDVIAALHEISFEVAVETNGTCIPPHGIDWLCVSPKAGTSIQVTSGDELKLVYPQSGAEPEMFECMDFKHFFLQPMDGQDSERNTRLAINYCLENPRWSLSVQRHKLLGVM